MKTKIITKMKENMKTIGIIGLILLAGLISLTSCPAACAVSPNSTSYYPEILTDDVAAQIMHLEEDKGMQLVKGKIINYHEGKNFNAYTLTQDDENYFHSQAWHDYKLYLKHPDFQVPDWICNEYSLSFTLVEATNNGMAFKAGDTLYYDGSSYTLQPYYDYEYNWNHHTFTADEIEFLKGSSWPIARHIISQGEW